MILKAIKHGFLLYMLFIKIFLNKLKFGICQFALKFEWMFIIYEVYDLGVVEIRGCVPVSEHFWASGEV